MGTIADMVPRVREALSVDDSYDAEIIPYGLQRAMTRLLRDYHFPWAVMKQVYTGLAEGKQDYTLPVGFKKDLLAHFYDTEAKTYSAPLLKVEGFRLPYSDGVPRHFWFAGGSLWTDITLDAGNAATTQLHLWFESMSWEDNEDWFTDRFEDILFTFGTLRLAAEKNKPEVAQIYSALWQEDQRSLAIYANELEFDNGVYVQREAAPPRPSRYPTSI